MTIYCSYCKEPIRSLAITEKDRTQEVSMLASIHLKEKHKKETKKLTEQIMRLNLALTFWIIFNEFDIPNDEKGLIKSMDDVITEHLEVFGLSETGDEEIEEETSNTVKIE